MPSLWKHFFLSCSLAESVNNKQADSSRPAPIGPYLITSSYLLLVPWRRTWTHDLHAITIVVKLNGFILTVLNWSVSHKAHGSVLVNVNDSIVNKIISISILFVIIICCFHFFLTSWLQFPFVFQLLLCKVKPLSYKGTTEGQRLTRAAHTVKILSMFA